jgi:tRNA threonylcarbamoyladenosine biosynthesis protein TsaB
MVVLALETATRRGSVALWIDHALDARAGTSTRTHGERLPGELLTLLADHHLAPRDVDLLAVISGPGSFTGLRVGMAAIQGLALTGGKKVVAVPTLEAMALAYLEPQGPGLQSAGPQGPGLQSHRGPDLHVGPIIVTCLDGQRGDIFFAAWRAGQSEPVIAPSVGRPSDLLEQLRGGRIGDATILVGDGAIRYAEVFRPLGCPIRDGDRPLAGVAASVAAARPELAVAPHALRPVYIRRPDAVLARERAGLTRS